MYLRLLAKLYHTAEKESPGEAFIAGKLLIDTIALSGGLMRG
jgi:hypothetical protein